MDYEGRTYEVDEGMCLSADKAQDDRHNLWKPDEPLRRKYKPNDQGKAHYSSHT